MFFVALTFWWLDRCRQQHQLDRATHRQLVVLGLLAVAVFNIRREGLAIIPASSALQVLELTRPLARRRPASCGHPLHHVRRRRGRLPAAAARGARPRLRAGRTGHGVEEAVGPVPSARSPISSAYRRSTGSGSPRFPAGGRRHGGSVVAGTEARIALVVFAGGVAGGHRLGTEPVADRYLMAITPFALYFGAQALANVPLPRPARPMGGRRCACRPHRVPLPKVQRPGRAACSGSATVAPTWSTDRSHRTCSARGTRSNATRTRTTSSRSGRSGRSRSTRIVVVCSRAPRYHRAACRLLHDETGQHAYQLLVTEAQGVAYGWTVVWQDELGPVAHAIADGVPRADVSATMQVA